MTLEERLKETEAKLAAAEAERDENLKMYRLMVKEYSEARQEIARLEEQLSDCAALHDTAKTQWRELVKERECNKVLREALKYIVNRGYTGAAFVALKALAKEQEMRK